jgi:hypothetical protein
MRRKPVPPAPDERDRLREARRAVPLVPGSEDDCCARIQRRMDLPGRDEARTWLTFLRALGLAEETAEGYARTRDDLDWEALPTAFLDGVFAAREVLAELDEAGEPLAPDAAFEAVADHVPQWERHKDPTWRDTWRGRVARILDWAVLFGLAERVDGTYRLADGNGVS